MAYIGKTPTVGNFQKCDAITTSATATFNLLVGGVAVSPETANHCIVSLNGVIQAPTSAFTISGSTIVFNSALTSADVIDFILLLGNVLDIGTPSDGTVTAAKIDDTAISGKTALAVAPADTDEFLVSDGGVLKRIDYSLIKGGGALTFLERITASGASASSFDGNFTSDYTNYIVYFADWSPVSDTGLQFVIRQSDSDVTSSDYQSSGQGNQRASGANTSIPSGGFGEAFGRISYQSTDGNTNFVCAGHITIYNPLGTTDYKNFTVNCLSHGTSGSDYLYSWIGTNYFDGNTTAMSGITFKAASGNHSGVFDLYGIKNS